MPREDWGLDSVPGERYAMRPPKGQALPDQQMASWLPPGSEHTFSLACVLMLLACNAELHCKREKASIDEAAPCSWCRFQRGFWVGAELHSQITEWYDTVPSLPSEELPSTDHFLCPANTYLFTYVLSSDHHSNAVSGYCCFSHSADKKLRLREAKSWPVTVARTHWDLPPTSVPVL